MRVTPAEARREVVRGAWTGALYSAAYLAVELLGMEGMFRWSGITGVLGEVTGPLSWLLVQYCVFGAIAGMALAVPVGRASAALPMRYRGVVWNLVGMGAAFVVLAFFWNSESVVRRRIYAMAAGITLVLLLVARFASWIARRAGMSRLLARTPRRMRIAGLLLVLLGVLWHGATRPALPGESRGAAAPRAGGPDVVLIVVDTLRRDHVSSYGYPRRTSPHLDRLAAEGTLYERAQTTAPWTLPAHASLFTGLYPSSHQMYYGHTRLAPSSRTLATVLRDHGYRTAGFSANPWIGPLTGLDRGFERFESRVTEFTTDSLFLSLAKRTYPADKGGRDLTDRLLGWMRSRHAQGERFFAFINYMEAHEPYGTVPEAFLLDDVPFPRGIGRQWLRETPRFLCDTCDPVDAPPEASSDPAGGLECRGGRWRPTAERLRLAQDLYDAGIRYVDDQIGRVYDALARSGRLDDTLLIVTSDHGEFFGEGGRMGHGAFLYRPVLDVPLVIRYPPRFPAHLRVAAPVSLVQVLPTVADAARARWSHPQGSAGLIVDGAKADAPPTVLAEQFPIEAGKIESLSLGYRCDYRRIGFRRASLQRGSLKYLWASGEAAELYDLERDPGEQLDLARRLPDVARALDTELHGRLRALAPGGPNPPAGIVPVREKALRSLGYVQ